MHALTFVTLMFMAAQEPQLSPNKADEALTAKMSVRKAAAFMDEAAVAWTRKKNCGSCHTNCLYLIARPSVKELATPAEAEVRGWLEKKASNWDTKKPQWDMEVVVTAATLALHDAGMTGKLHSVTKLAFERMWKLQRDDGAWDWLKCSWPPMEHDDYFGATLAAVGVGAAPEGYASSEDAKVGIAKLKKYLASNAAPDLHHQAMLMWASQKLDGLLTKKEQQTTIERLLAQQRPDGGWNLASLGDYKRHDKTPNAKDGPSDGYGTGFVIFVLRQAGVPSSNKQIQAGVDWLRANQRESGRWFTRSLSNDSYHFITHAGTAYAIMALRACDVPLGD